MCRASSSICDEAEYCDGINSNCPTGKINKQTNEINSNNNKVKKK